MMMFRGRILRSLSLSLSLSVRVSLSASRVSCLVDRSSSASRAGNTNRDAKITLISLMYRGGKEQRERKREREIGRPGVASSLINDASSTSAGGGVSDYARCNQPLYYITG